MAAIRYFAFSFLVALIILSRPSVHSEASGSDRAINIEASLFAQSAGKLLNRDFPDQGISFLLLDAKTGRVLASRWADPELPIPPGSLVKPFTAMAYGEQHGFKYPPHVCHGTASGCWFPAGHGSLDLPSAIAYSCNSYFRMLTADLTGAAVAPTAIRFGIEAPPLNASGLALAGFGNQWLVSPLRLARAYLELVRRTDESGVRQVVEGMDRSAREGTGAEVDRLLPYPGALVKTGTASCTHAEHAPGDGFAVVLAPADQPQTLLMVRVHGVPGAHAAKIAGEMIRDINRQ